MKLTMAGLRSYQHKTEIDFTDLSLFALIGDTGAGKSSIIEALCLALYGSTTWSGRNVVELMCDASAAMSVELVFAAAGDVWTVTRGHRRAGLFRRGGWSRGKSPAPFADTVSLPD